MRLYLPKRTSEPLDERDGDVEDVGGDVSDDIDVGALDAIESEENVDEGTFDMTSETPTEA
jgi:hypothetical protein